MKHPFKGMGLFNEVEASLNVVVDGIEKSFPFADINRDIRDFFKAELLDDGQPFEACDNNKRRCVEEYDRLNNANLLNRRIKSCILKGIGYAELSVMAVDLINRYCIHHTSLTMHSTSIHRGESPKSFSGESIA